jgi:hypothetical protein
VLKIKALTDANYKWKVRFSLDELRAQNLYFLFRNETECFESFERRFASDQQLRVTQFETALILDFFIDHDNLKIPAQLKFQLIDDNI